MSNEETGRLIDDIAHVVFMRSVEVVTLEDAEAVALTIVGELQSKYRLTPIEDNQQETT